MVNPALALVQRTHGLRNNPNLPTFIMHACMHACIHRCMHPCKIIHITLIPDRTNPVKLYPG